jgi:uncharacterized membrane protein YkvA (DUF1232 family)
MERPYNGDHPEEFDQLDIPESEEEYHTKEDYVRENLDQKLQSLRGGIRLAKHVLALFRYMTDEAVPWYKKSIVVAALVYFITPFDAIPDLLPLVGYLDDFGVIAAVLAFLGKEIQPYYYSSPAMGDQDEDRSIGDSNS